MNHDVLLVCPEPLGHGRPAGVGIRFIEIAKVLAELDFRVRVMSPDGADLPGAKGRAISPEALLDESRKAGVAVVQGHIANDFFAHAERIPTVVDMYDPYLIENLSYAVENQETWQHDWNTTLQSLRRGDFFLCASQRQRAYYLGWFAALGRINPRTFESDPTIDSLLQVVPFGVPSARSIPDKSLEKPSILFGGVYDWYDPVVAIEAVKIARESVPELTLTFVSHPNAEVTPQSKYGQAKRVVERSGLDDMIQFRDWFPYEYRGRVYDEHALAILTFPRSLETELSFRTRVLDYLWGGLPVFSSSAAGTDEILERYEAGVVLDTEEPAEIARQLVSVLTEPALHRTLVEGTQRFVRDYQWRDLVGPLAAFCRNPGMDPHAERFISFDGTAEIEQPSLLGRAIRKLSKLSSSNQ